MAGVEPSSQGQAQPWKAWYKASNSPNFNPLSKAVSLGLGAQGSFPQKPRQVDLSQKKESVAVKQGEL